MDIKEKLKQRFNVTENWDKHDYAIHRYSFDDLLEAAELVKESDSLPPVSDSFVLLGEIEGDEYYWNGKEWADSKEGCPTYEYEKAVEYSGVFGCRFTDAE